MATSRQQHRRGVKVCLNNFYLKAVKQDFKCKQPRFFFFVRYTAYTNIFSFENFQSLIKNARIISMKKNDAQILKELGSIVILSGRKVKLLV